MRKCNIKMGSKNLIENIQVANNFGERLVGLMFKEKPQGNGLLIQPCNSIHTCFMKYPIDVIFLDQKNIVVHVIQGISPWRMTWIYFKAARVLEVPTNYWKCDLKIGDQIEVEYV